MSLLMNSGSKPEFTISSHCMGRNIVLSGNRPDVISAEDVLEMAYYVLTNTDLDGPDDPRLKFIKRIELLDNVPGYNAARNPEARKASMSNCLARVLCVLCTRTVSAEVTVVPNRMYRKANLRVLPGSRCPRCSASLDSSMVLGDPRELASLGRMAYERLASAS